MGRGAASRRSNCGRDHAGQQWGYRDPRSGYEDADLRRGTAHHAVSQQRGAGQESVANPLPDTITPTTTINMARDTVIKRYTFLLLTND